MKNKTVSGGRKSEKSGKMTKKKKIIIITFVSLAVAAAIILAVCLIITDMKSVKPIDGTEEEMAVVGTVLYGEKSYNILYEEYRFITLLYRDSIARIYGKDSSAWNDAEFREEHRKELEDAVNKNLMNNYAILALCDEYMIATDSDEVNDQVNSEIEKLVKGDFDGDMSEYKKWLKENNLTDHYLRFMSRINYIEAALYYLLADNKMFIDYNNTNYSDYINYVMEGGKYCRTLSIYVKSGDIEKDLADATEIINTLNAETDAEKRLTIFKSYIGSSYNKDFGLTTTDGYYFTEGEMSADYEKASFALNVGEISEPVLHDNGYYIIIRLNLDSTYVTENWQTLLKGYQSAQVGKLETVFLEGMEFVPNKSGSQYDLTNMK